MIFARFCNRLRNAVVKEQGLGSQQASSLRSLRPRGGLNPFFKHHRYARATGLAARPSFPSIRSGTTACIKEWRPPAPQRCALCLFASREHQLKTGAFMACREPSLSAFPWRRSAA